ncbi:MAG: hypothetical protein H0U22_00605 [Geodermatophilaceae bacterium]|nr:hypothetical protein [Geodermatophilaceae bacterium]
MTATGRLVIMGSGETAPAMIKAHRMLLERVPEGAAVLLDTPYGFQENADDITARARQYFRASVGHDVTVAGWRSADTDGLTRERALTALRAALWVFAGPGSPTYALRAWRDTALPRVLRETVFRGGTLVFASAAALTLGSHTVPVYEIYKAGLRPYWEPGLDLVAALTGLPAVVIPHYDNTEGGHHDTRFCYLGERRLSALEAELPEDRFVLGVDEHTAVVLDVGAGTVSVLGNGGLTIRRRGESTFHAAGTDLRLADLATVPALDDPAGSLRNLGIATAESGGLAANRPMGPDLGSASESERSAVEQCRRQFSASLAGRDVDAAVSAALDLEQTITDRAAGPSWADEELDAHGVLRSMIVELGELARTGAADPVDAIRPFVDLLVILRDRVRAEKDFAAGDEIRDFLTSAGVELRDTATGPTWSLRADPCSD